MVSPFMHVLSFFKRPDNLIKKQNKLDLTRVRTFKNVYLSKARERRWVCKWRQFSKKSTSTSPSFLIFRKLLSDAFIEPQFETALLKIETPSCRTVSLGERMSKRSWGIKCSFSKVLPKFQRSKALVIIWRVNEALSINEESGSYK